MSSAPTQAVAVRAGGGYVASPEDVIIGKLWYYQKGEHEKHLRDVAAMVQLSGDEIDEDYIRRWTVSSA